MYASKGGQYVGRCFPSHQPLLRLRVAKGDLYKGSNAIKHCKMVPVFDINKVPLMPCSEKRAKKLMDKGDAKPYWYKGIFCIILQREPSHRYMQDIVIAIDPGSKFNGYTIKSEAHTLLNLQVNAIADVKERVEERAEIRKCRRHRNTPYRKHRFNRRIGNFLAPSSKARWQQHLNIIKFTQKMYKITDVAVEDVMAKSKKGAKKWNKNFSPLEVGKNWLYKSIREVGLGLFLYKGYETAQMRADYNLKKNSLKSKKCFYTHCVDTFCLATEVIGGNGIPDNTFVKYLKPLRYYRRQLHPMLPTKGGIRRNFGSTLSLGITRGTLVKHPKVGLAIVGGTSKGLISLHDFKTNKRIYRSAKKEDLKILTRLSYSLQ